MMKFLITGGTGFVGSFLTQQLLKNEHEVTVIGHSSAKRSSRAFSFDLRRYDPKRFLAECAE